MEAMTVIAAALAEVRQRALRAARGSGGALHFAFYNLLPPHHSL
jgi:hypothetical protein